MTSPHAVQDAATRNRVTARRSPPSQPGRSLVLISRGSRSALQRSLARLARAARSHRNVVIVRGESPWPELRKVLARSGATYVEAPANAPVSAMRKLGMATATGDIVRIVDDAEVKDSVWIQWGVDDAHEEREVPLPPVVDTVDVRPTRPQPSTRHSESTRHIAAG